MARHRDIRGRKLSYDDDYDDVIGHSVEEDSYLASPSDGEFIYDRDRNQQVMSNFFQHHNDIEEENEEPDLERPKFDRRESLDFRSLELNDEQEAKLMSCLDQIRNVLGDSYSDQILVSAVLETDFDVNKALDTILDNNKPNAQLDPENIKEKPVNMPFKVKLDLPKNVAPVIETASKNVVKGFKVENLASEGICLRSQSPPSGRVTPHRQNENVDDTKIKENKINPTVQYQAERGSDKEHIYIIVIGHVDAGKSTLMGRLLCELGEVNQRTLHKFEQESKKIGKQSFMYAWVLDETEEERSRGITMDVGRAQFNTKSKQVVILDAPGHADFIPNMISGAGQADVALLVVDATRGEFETGFDQGGQTREHALLVRSLGVNQLAVAVNKLDTSNWSEERFNEITKKLKVFLKQAGFKDSDVTFVPCSGLTGENIVRPSTIAELTKWYKGPSLIDIIDSFNTPERPVTKPLRMSINDIYKGTGSGFCVSGRLETGVLNKGDKVLVCPNREIAEVKQLLINDMPQVVAFAGDQVSVTLSGVEMQNVSVGCILSDPVQQVPVASKFEARIVVFNLKVPITKGFPVLIHHQSLIESASIVKLKALLNKSTGEIIKKKPRCLSNNSVAIIDIEVSRPICIEMYKNIKELGRFMLRVGGVTIAAGLITDIN